MAQPQLLQIKLSRFDAQPWGFRLQGGVDFSTPLVVQKVNGGSLAEKAGLIPGDAVLKINDVDVFNLRHKDAQDVVVRSGNNFVLTVQRGGSTWRPHVTPTGNIPQPQQNSPYLQTVTKTSLAHKQQDSQHIGCGYNNAARPFVNGGDGNVKSIVNKQYNTPVGIYSDESIAETLSAQAEVLAGGVLGVNFKKNEKEYQPDKSEVLKFLREEETGASTPEPPAPANFYWTQSHAIGGNEHRTPLSHKHQHPIQEEKPQDESIGTNLQEKKLCSNSAQRASLAQSAKPSSSEPADPRVIIMPVCPALQGPEYKAEMQAAAAALQHDDAPRPLSASGHPTCALCGVGIVGVFVRIKDKNLHVECFKCATCGTSLKNQGYYNYNNKLYCDIHAKLAALQNPPSGTDGYVPVPIKPNTKLSANTISSALNAHGFSDVPVTNGGSVAPPIAPTAESHDGIKEIQGNNIDLPLPPPTSLQQLGMDNGSEITTSNSLSASTAGHLSQIEDMMEGTINSCQAFSSPSLICGIKTDNNATILIATTPPPPPPLPSSCQVNLRQQKVQQQNEYDMNSQNQFDSGVGGVGLGGISHDSSVGQTGGGKYSLSGGIYSKFLKEYSNKLLTLNKQNNNNTLSNTNIRNDVLSPNINANSYKKNNLINTYHSPSKQTTQAPAQSAPHSLQSYGSTTVGSTKTQSPENSVVAALSPTFANHLKFNSCQQVAKPAATLEQPPPSTPDSFSTAKASTSISSAITDSTLLNTINNSNLSNNNRETTTTTQTIHNKGTNFTSEMLANPSLALDTTSNDQPFGEYVTLTGSIIRSVVPPGKGVNINYKVNQGYTRPFGAGPVAAPKSPVAYPPQRPAVNSYATLPRTNIGQQGLTDIKTNAQATAIATANAANAIDTVTSQAPYTATSAATAATATTSFPPPNTVDKSKSNVGLNGSTGVGGKAAFSATSAPKRGRGIFNKAVSPGVRVPLCSSCNIQIRGPFITALGRIWCPEHFICVNANCRRPLQDIGFVEEKGDLYCEYCFEKYLAPTCSKCGSKIKGDCLNAIGKQFHPECFTCGHCGKLFGNTPFFLEDGNAYCEADWNELFTTKCFACGFPVEAGDRWVEALNHNYHSQCFNCTYCKQNLEGQSFYNKGGRPFCKNHAR
ncbi:PDZ and LIM domain protein Zasp isoform X11 [Bactrocera oleae]|uniref:PDZ and LIM domain protein Zasp isoform X11 n=1 Tax=Bactrocera oleae TaxID=104688 RepID=UPI00387EDF73